LLCEGYKRDRKECPYGPTKEKGTLESIQDMLEESNIALQ
jgi:hypothetical protein